MGQWLVKNFYMVALLSAIRGPYSTIYGAPNIYYMRQ